MRRTLYPLAVIALVLISLVFAGTGCGKKNPEPAVPTATRPPEAVETPPTPPAPTITLSVSPAAITKGQSSTLSWRTTNATEVAIDGGVGTVEAAGSRVLAPAVSTTYRARATGPGGVADAEARITVSAEEVAAVIPGSTRRLNDAEFFATNIKDAFFDYDSYSLRDDARQALMESARYLKDRPNIRFTIEGHCDERGSEAYNLALGEKRAAAARDFLVSQGVDPARMDTISYGEEKPFAPGHDEDAWRQNRRAHLAMR